MPKILLCVKCIVMLADSFLPIGLHMHMCFLTINNHQTGLMWSYLEKIWHVWAIVGMCGHVLMERTHTIPYSKCWQSLNAFHLETLTLSLAYQYKTILKQVVWVILQMCKTPIKTSHTSCFGLWLFSQIQTTTLGRHRANKMGVPLNFGEKGVAQEMSLFAPKLQLGATWAQDFAVFTMRSQTSSPMACC